MFKDASKPNRLTSEKNNTCLRRTSGRFIRNILEGGTAITKGDSSMHVTSREDLPVGQDMEAEDSDCDDTNPG
jgi:hypothetical protein